MPHHARMLASTLLAALGLAAALAASADGEIVEFFPTPTMPALRATLTFTSESVTLTCPVTLHGSLTESQITLATEAVLGRVTSVETARCSPEGTLTVLSLPWTVKYRGFGGTLPESVTELNVRVSTFAGLVSFFGASCLYSGDAELSSLMASGRNSYQMERVNLSGSLAKVAGGILCPARPTLAGRGIFSSLWAILFGESLPMRATPAWTTKTRATGGVAISVTALQNVNVTGVGLEQNNLGWVLTLPPGGCNRAYVPGEARETCTVTIHGEGATGLDHLLFHEGANVVAKVPLEE